MIPEQEAKQLIDGLLNTAGRQVQDYRSINLGTGLGVAVREFPLKTGFADVVTGKLDVRGVELPATDEPKPMQDWNSGEADDADEIDDNGEGY